MRMQDYESDNESRSEDESAVSPEDELHYFDVEFQCEECDYRWKSKQKAYLSDADTTGSDRWTLDDTNVTCPICGSYSVTRV